MIKGAVVCPEPLAAQVGAEIFRCGGTTADATVAAAFAQAVTNPLGTGIGGMAQALIASPKLPRPVSINATVEVGSRAEGMFEHEFAGRSERAGRYLVHEDRNQYGYQSIMTPGFVRGMEAILAETESRLPWNEIVQPAATLASRGFEVYPYLSRYYSLEGPARPGYPDIYRKLADEGLARERYLPNGEPLPEGWTLRQPEYGATLARLASYGADDLYAGAVAEIIAADFSAQGASVTGDDLANYRVRVETPVAAEFREVCVYSAPPPSHGLILLMMLLLVEPLEIESLNPNDPEYLELITWAMRTAFAECMPYLGDPLFLTVPTNWLLSKEHLDSIREHSAVHKQSALVTPDGNTTHVSSGDRKGNFLSITHSIGSIAGAGVMTDGLGFLYNNFLGQFNVLRGHHDSMDAGKRLGGGCPTIVSRDGLPWLAIGSSGGPRLFSAVFQTLLNVILFGMTLQEAVTAPRVHSEQDGRIYVEPELVKRTQVELAKRGYEVVVTSYMGCNQAVARGMAGLEVGADPRGGRGVGLA